MPILAALLFLCAGTCLAQDRPEWNTYRYRLTPVEGEFAAKALEKY